MRIIAGEYRGRTIKAPKGDATRPTTDRVRESLMSTISSARGGFDNAVVLDVFAGSGALGLEALSRGAQTVTFYEKSAAAVRVLRENTAGLKLDTRQYAIYQADVLKYPPRFAGKAFDLVFLDPPYVFEVSAIFNLLEVMATSGALAQDALISYEHAKTMNSASEERFNSLQWEIVSQKSYGDTSIDIIRYRGETLDN